MAKSKSKRKPSRLRPPAIAARNKARREKAYAKWLEKRRAINLAKLPAKLEAKRIKMQANLRKAADREIKAKLIANKVKQTMAELEAKLHPNSAAIPEEVSAILTKNQVGPITATVDELLSAKAQ